MSVDLTRTSKFLSLVLRHKPEEIGLRLDDQGWAEIDDLIRLSNSKGQRLTRELVEQIVADCNKQRFAISEDGRRIRANQGHSVAIDLALPPREPPELLYHGTASRFVSSIQATGLEKRQRQHVHLSLDVTTAIRVGERHGKPVILVVQARRMHTAGHQFFLSDNGVWLTDHVPVEYLQFPD
jgi:putative RNA 2'-phosphotransferase